MMTEEYDRYEREGGNPYILVFGVDERSFLDWKTESLLLLSWDTFNFTSSTVLLKMESPAHNAAIGAFTRIIDFWVLKQKTNLMSMATMHVRGATRGKKADIAWLPAEPPSGRSHKWPTIAVEIAYSEPRRKLEEDMKFWLNDSNGDVNVALTITIERRGLKITVEKWSLQGQRATPTQKMEIVRHPEPNCPSVTGGISFAYQDAFLRQKSHTETDFVLTAADMQQLGTAEWAVT